MALLSVIRRWHFREELSIREICRRTGLSRNTIRKYLRLDGVEPKFKVPERSCRAKHGHEIRILARVVPYVRKSLHSTGWSVAGKRWDSRFEVPVIVCIAEVLFRPVEDITT